MEGKHPGSHERWKEETSFVAAAELWGIGSDVMALPSIVLRADQVPIVGVQKPGRKPNDLPQLAGYKLATVLMVDKITLTRRTEAVEISVKQVESYKTPVFVSDKASIKLKALHEVNQNTEHRTRIDRMGCEH